MLLAVVVLNEVLVISITGGGRGGDGGSGVGGGNWANPPHFEDGQR